MLFRTNNSVRKEVTVEELKEAARSVRTASWDYENETEDEDRKRALNLIEKEMKYATITNVIYETRGIGNPIIKAR